VKHVPAAFTLFSPVSDHGNTWLHTEEYDAHFILLTIVLGWWLVIKIDMSSDPGLSVMTTKATHEEMAKKINKDYEGWTVRRCNIDGVLTHSEDDVTYIGEE
jgi:hypothetical protein